MKHAPWTGVRPQSAYRISHTLTIDRSLLLIFSADHGDGLHGPRVGVFVLGDCAGRGLGTSQDAPDFPLVAEVRPPLRDATHGR